VRKGELFQVCGKLYCDYVPCVELRIAQLDAEGFDTSALRDWLAELRAQDGRMADAEKAWLAAIDAGVALV
jgi:hypothetical protein